MDPSSVVVGLGVRNDFVVVFVFDNAFCSNFLRFVELNLLACMP